MEEYPPIDFLAAGWIKANKPKPIAEQVGASGLPYKKGMVKKRGNLSG